MLINIVSITVFDLSFENDPSLCKDISLLIGTPMV